MVALLSLVLIRAFVKSIFFFFFLTNGSLGMVLPLVLLIIAEKVGN